MFLGLGVAGAPLDPLLHSPLVVDEGVAPGPCSEQGFFYRPVIPNRRPPVPVNRTGLTRNQLKLDKFKFQIQTPVQTISTGKPTGLLG